MKTMQILLGTTALVWGLAGTAYAQTAVTPATPNAEPAQEVETIIVVGSQIRGASTTAVLPVAVFTQEEMMRNFVTNTVW